MQASNLVTNERNEAVARLGQEMNLLEKLEREKKDLMSRLDTLTQVCRIPSLSSDGKCLQEQSAKTASIDMGKNVGDLNMKLKLEIGSLKGENEGLLKRNDEILQEVSDLQNQMQVGLACVI